ATESVTFIYEQLSVLAVDFAALALAIGTVGSADLGALVPGEAQPAERAQDDGFRLRGAAGNVGIFDAEDELTSVLAGKTVIKERGGRGADVGAAGGRGRDAGADHAESL